MRPPHQYGPVVPAIRTSKGTGILSAPLVLPDRTFEDVPWAAGEVISVDWTHVSWYSTDRQARIHLVTGGELSTTVFNLDRPWYSSPFAASLFTAGASFPSQAYSGLYCLIGVTNDEGDTLSWTGSGGLTFSEAEDYSFDTAGTAAAGHVGYWFGTISGTGVLTMASSGTPTESFWGWYKLSVASGSPAFSTIVAASSDTPPGAGQWFECTLTADIDPGSQIVPVVFFGPPSSGIDKYDGNVAQVGAMEWPLVYNWTREQEVKKMAYYKATVPSYGVNYFSLWRHIGGAGEITRT